MTGAMMKLATKLGARLPELLARAALGDPTAIAILGAAGVVAIGALIENKRENKA